MHGTFVQEPLCRLTDNIHGDVRHSQRLELSVLPCCSSRGTQHVFGRGTTSSAWHTAVLAQAYTPCSKLSRAFGATFTEWAISNRLSILHFRFLAFWHRSISCMVPLKLALPLGLLYRWTTMVPQAWPWRAGDLKHVVDLWIMSVIAIGCTGFCSHCFKYYKCQEAAKMALASCQLLKSWSQAVQGEYVDCRTVAWQDEDSLQASMILDVRSSISAKLCTLQPCCWTGPDGDKLRQVGSWVDGIEPRWLWKGIEGADTSNDSKKHTQSHRNRRPSKIYRCLLHWVQTSGRRILIHEAMQRSGAKAFRDFLAGYLCRRKYSRPWSFAWFSNNG